jgi:hypothetical protein
LKIFSICPGKVGDNENGIGSGNGLRTHNMETHVNGTLSSQENSIKAEIDVIYLG